MKFLFIFISIIFLYAEEISTISKSFPALIKEYKNKQTQQNVKQLFSRDFSLYPYQANYFLPVTWDFNKKLDRREFESKFQISIMKPFGFNLLNKNELYFFTYTQLSLWQTSAPSGPFRESNYEPEIAVLFPTEEYHKNWDGVLFALNHQSNGRDVPYSRSWNRFYTKFLFHYSDIIFNLRVWYRIPEPKKKYPNDPDGDDNPDIEDYLGYGDFKIIYPYKDHLITTLLRYNPTTKKGAFQIDYSKPIRGKDIFLYIQYFRGYGESLIDYKTFVNKIGIGFEYSR